MKHKTDDDAPTLPYAPIPPARPVSRGATGLLLVLTFLLPATFVAFAFLRRHQLSLPDPYNNPYTNWSTACLFSFIALAIINVLVMAALHRRIARWILWLAGITAGLAWLYIARCVFSLLQFLYP